MAFFGLQFLQKTAVEICLKNSYMKFIELSEQVTIFQLENILTI